MVPKLPVREQKIDHIDQVGFVHHYPQHPAMCQAQSSVIAQLLFEGWVDEERKKGGREGKGKEEERKKGREGGKKEEGREGRWNEGVMIFHFSSLLPKGKALRSRQRKCS